MIKALTEKDYCPHCTEEVLYMAETDLGFTLVKFSCSKCEYFEVRQLKTENK